MPEGNKRSRTFRRVYVKTPGGRVVIHYKKRKPSHAKCAVTGKKLAGVPRERPAKLKKYTKSSRRPERPYGGILSSEALRELMKRKARSFLDMIGGKE